MEKFKFPRNILLTKFPSEERKKSNKNHNSGDYGNCKKNSYIPYASKSSPISLNSQKIVYIFI